MHGPVHDAWIQSPKPTARVIEVAREVGLGALTLCPLMPNGKGSLRARYKPHDLAERIHDLSDEGFRAGIMIWADTTPADVDLTRDWIRANESALLACGLFGLDAEESYVRGSKASRGLFIEMIHEEIERLRSKGWRGEVSVTATQWDLSHGRVDDLIAAVASLLRPQWYVFRKPGGKKHWSHYLGEPEAQIKAWVAQLAEVLGRVHALDPTTIHMDVDAGLAAYWLRGVKGHKGSIPAAVAAALRGARSLAKEVAVCLWSLNWFDGAGGAEAIVRRAYAAELRGGKAPEDDGADDTTPPEGAAHHPGDRERIRELQRQLAAAGYDPGPLNGMWGERTRDAAKRWDVDRFYAPDGWYLDHNGPQISAIVSKMGLEVA